MLSKIREHPESELEGTRELEQPEAEKKRVVIINIIQTVGIIFAIIIAGYSLLIQASTDEENQVQENGELFIHTVQGFRRNLVSMVE